MRRSQCALMAVVGFVLMASTALAGDLFPPSPSNPFAPWNRGAPGTTFNEWRFLQPTPNPDIFQSNPSTGAGFISNTDGSHWLPPGNPGGFDGNGTWSIPPGGFLEFTIPNFGPTSGPKFIYLQIKYAGALPGWDVVSGTTHGVHPPGFPTATPGPTGQPGVSQWSDTLMLPFNPQFEIVRIFNPSAQDKCFLDQVCLDTICTPTPGAAGLLALGGMIAVGRRRRR